MGNETIHSGADVQVPDGTVFMDFLSDIQILVKVLAVGYTTIIVTIGRPGPVATDLPFLSAPGLAREFTPIGIELAESANAVDNYSWINA
ncbi:hypothetical protein GCM10027456_31820 [Kineosporia babensis]